MTPSRDGSFHEVADRVWVARHAWFDVNVTVVGGSRGLVVVDTHASDRAATGVLERVRALGAGEVVGVVNTHEHVDHVLGNAAVRRAWPDVPIHAHEVAAERTAAAVARAKALYEADPDDPHRDEVLASEVVAADHPFSSVAVLDLGDRAVELVHPGRGHTSGDLVVRVRDPGPDGADVLLAGDLVEESAERAGVPGFGADCHPMEWPLTLDLVLDLVGERTVVVPGHGAPVERDFVAAQRADIGVVAETIRDLAGRGVPLSEAVDAAEWPFPRSELADAVRRGYEHLPRAQKRLPLV